MTATPPEPLRARLFQIAESIGGTSYIQANRKLHLTFVPWPPVTTGYLAATASFFTTLLTWRFLVTTDEELNVLETQLRRLKIEYEVYFSNPTKRPPTDIEWKVLSSVAQIFRRRTHEFFPALPL